MKSAKYVMSMMVLFAIVLGACAPAAPVTVVVTAPPVVQTAVVTSVVQATAGPTSAPAATPATSFAGLKDPKDVALAAAGGQKIGGILAFLGVSAAPTLPTLQAVPAPLPSPTTPTLDAD